eukprot:3099925-Amphidinium_carterae.2
MGQSLPVVRLEVEQVHRETKTMDNIALKRAGTQGFVMHLSQRCMHCRMGAPEALKIYKCQAYGCT